MKGFKKSGLILAGAAAALLASGFVATASATGNHEEVKCMGGNACKGKSDCKGKGLDGTENSCKGQNSCKGKGWSKMAADACKKVKGAKAESLEDKKS